MQSAASKHPAVKLFEPQAGTSQRQLPAAVQSAGVVRAVHGSAGQLGRRSAQVPFAVHWAAGPQSPGAA